MNLIQRFKTAFDILFRQREINFVNFPQGFNASTSRAFKFRDYALEGFIQNPSVFACVDYISRATKAIKFQLQRDGEDVEDDDPAAQEILDLLKRPNPTQAMPEFMSSWSIDMQLGGISYIQMVGVGSETLGDIERVKTEGEVWLLRPDTVEIVHSIRMIEKYIWMPEGTVAKLDLAPEEVFYTRYPNPLDMFAGMPPIRAAARIIDAHNRALTWWDRLVANMGRLSGVLGLKGMSNYSKDNLEELQNNWTKKYSGPQNAGKTAILPGEGFDYTDLGKTPAELDWLGSEAVLTRRVCTVFGVPSQLLGDPDTSKYSNYKEARHAFYTEKILPDNELFVSEWNAFLMPKFGDEWSIRSDFTQIDALRDDENDRVDRLVKRNWWKENEKRAADGLEDADGGDVILKPFNQIPLDSIDTDDAGERATRSDDILPNVHPRSRYPTEADRVFAFEQNLKLSLEWEKKYVKALNKFWSGQRDRIIKALEKELRAEADDLIAKLFKGSVEDKALTEAMGEVYTGLMVEFGQDVLDDLVAKGILFDIERPALVDFVAKDLPLRSNLINETTATRLQNIINQGVAKNEGVLKIRDRILDKFTEMSKGRARTIAQTEVGQASAKATFEGMKQTEDELDIRLEKEWLSSRDADVREDHVFMDGQTRELDEPFDGPGGQQSQQVPPDSGDPAFDINCRCVAVALRPGEKKI